MGAFPADLGLLGTAIDSVQQFVKVFFSVYQFTLLAYILSSWIRVPVSMMRVQRFLYDVCDPYLRLFRRILPSMGPLDLSPLVGLIALAVIEVVVLKILDQFR
jgi:uncharacterized protein YggT (Ycf19 family)